MTEQDVLRADLDRVADYGERHAATWTGVCLEGSRLVALFTDPEPHREPLLSLLDHPEFLELRRSGHNRRDLEAVYTQVRRILDANPRCWTSHSPGLNAVQVSLRGGYDTLADELYERFGDAIEVRVGVHRYPFDLGSTPDLGPARHELDGAQLPGALFEAVPEPDTLKAGATVTGYVRVTNRAFDRRLTFDTDQPLTGHLLDAAGRIVGTSSGFSAGTGLVVDLGPGESGEIGFIAGTDSLDPRQGSALPSGRYTLAVGIPIRSMSHLGARLVIASSDIELGN